MFMGPEGVTFPAHRVIIHILRETSINVCHLAVIKHAGTLSLTVIKCSLILVIKINPALDDYIVSSMSVTHLHYYQWFPVNKTIEKKVNYFRQMSGILISTPKPLEKILNELHVCHVSGKPALLSNLVFLKGVGN